jgi:hypothetical protein
MHRRLSGAAERPSGRAAGVASRVQFPYAAGRRRMGGCDRESPEHLFLIRATVIDTVGFSLTYRGSFMTKALAVRYCTPPAGPVSI